MSGQRREGPSPTEVLLFAPKDRRAGLPEWPRYDAATRRSLVVSTAPTVEEDLGATSRALWG